MIKYCLMLLTAALSLSVALPATAWAQQNLLVQVLQKKYEIVLPSAADEPILVNKGGRISGLHAALNGKSGYVDSQGREIVRPTYDYAETFQNGYAVVAKRESEVLKCGLIDRTGKVVVPLEWDDMNGVQEGIAVAVRGQKPTPSYFLIDTLGKTTALEYNICRSFSNGYAVVGSGEYRPEEQQATPGMTQTKPKYYFAGKYGYITPDGKLALALQYDEARDFGEDGLAAVAVNGKYYPKWGFIDKKGTVFVPCNYYEVANFSCDRAKVGKVVGGKLVYGYLDRGGKELIPCQFDMASSFRFKNTWVGVEKDGEMQYMLIDLNGNTVMGMVLELNDSGKFGQATAAIRDANGRLRYGILDISGKVLLPFEYDQITLFSEIDPSTGRMKEAAMASKNGQSFSFDITNN